MKIVNDIDSGNSNIDESQTIEIASAIGELVSRYNKPKIPNKLTRLEACRHLRVSETKFNTNNKELLSKQLELIGKLKAKIVEEDTRELDLFNEFKEYSKTHPNATYNEFLKSK